MSQTNVIKEKLTDNQVAQFLRESANQVWLAGLGAYGKAEDEGSRLFEGLVKQGEELEARTREEVKRQIKATEGRFGALRDRAEARIDLVRDRCEDAVNPYVEKVREEADRAREKASEKLTLLEKGFDERVAATLSRLGVPTKTELSDLTERVEELDATVRKLRRSSRTPARKTQKAGSSAVA